MYAFPDSHRRLITQQIRLLADRMVHTITPSPALGYGDVMDLLSIKGELRRVLLDGRKLINVSDTEANYVGADILPGINLGIFVNGLNAPLMPREAELSKDFLQNDGRGRALLKRAGELGQLSDDWGLVDHVFENLNNVCSSPAQVRYVWPSVLALMASVDNETTQALHSKLLPLKVPREMPSIPFELRALIRRASTIISMSTLIGDGNDAKASKDVSLVIATGYHRQEAGYYTMQLRVI